MDKFWSYLLTILICLVAIGQFVQVVARYILEIPVMGLEETMVYAAIWLYILGAVNASREDTHIRANVLEIFLSTERAHAIAAIIGEVISIVVGLWLLRWAWDFTAYSMRVDKETATLYLPTIYSDMALFIGLILMMVYTSRHLLAHIRILIRTGARQ